MPHSTRVRALAARIGKAGHGVDSSMFVLELVRPWLEIIHLQLLLTHPMWIGMTFYFLSVTKNTFCQLNSSEGSCANLRVASIAATCAMVHKHVV